MKLNLNQNYATWILSHFLKLAKKILIFQSAIFFETFNNLQKHAPIKKLSNKDQNNEKAMDYKRDTKIY